MAGNCTTTLKLPSTVDADEGNLSLQSAPDNVIASVFKNFSDRESAKLSELSVEGFQQADDEMYNRPMPLLTVFVNGAADRRLE